MTKQHFLRLRLVATVLMFTALSALPLPVQAKNLSALAQATAADDSTPLSMNNPDATLGVALTSDNGQYSLRLTTADGALLTTIALGVKTDKFDFSRDVTLKSVSQPVDITEDYTALHGKSSHIINKGRAAIVTFCDPDGVRMDVEVRLYNDGLAFRYAIPNTTAEPLTFVAEQTAYTISPESRRWLQRYLTSYEADFPLQQEVRQGEWGYPALFETSGRFMLITEANATRQYCATHLSNSKVADTYTLTFPGAGEGAGVGNVQPQWRDAWQSPWRVVIAGSLKTLVASTLVEDVSDPCADPSKYDFVEAGRASWVYWAYNHGTKDFKVCCDYVDLAAEMGWEYVLFDWEWDAMTNGGTLHDATAYALKRGIKPLIWYNSGGPHNWIPATPRSRMLTHENRVKEFRWLKSLGVAGVKIDFFESDKQQMMQYYLDILDDAAEARMLVNFHGATVPRGWSRTYPHLMSMEAVFGAEQYNNSPRMTPIAARLNCTLPFTRNVVGPMDYTPVAFTNSQHPHTTTYAHELALSVAFESGVQHWADRPSGFRELPAEPKQLMKDVPAAWDETVLVDGYPGTHFVVARRRGTTWYVGGLNGTNEKRDFTVDLSFLPKGRYQALVIADGTDDKSFATSRRRVTATTKLRLSTLPQGGFTLKLTQ